MENIVALSLLPLIAEKTNQYSRRWPAEADTSPTNKATEGMYCHQFVVVSITLAGNVAEMLSRQTDVA